MSSAAYRLENNNSPTFKRNIHSVSGLVQDLTLTKGIHCTERTCKNLNIDGSHYFSIVYKISPELNLFIVFSNKQIIQQIRKN